jgi:hypothetical protein
VKLRYAATKRWAYGHNGVLFLPCIKSPPSIEGHSGEEVSTNHRQTKPLKSKDDKITSPDQHSNMHNVNVVIFSQNFLKTKNIVRLKWERSGRFKTKRLVWFGFLIFGEL